MGIKKMISILTLILIMFSMTACSLGGEKPEEAVTKALNALKALDVETSNKYFNYDELLNYDESKPIDPKSEEYGKLFFEKFSYKIISSSVDGETAVVKTEISNTDMKIVFGEYFSQAITMAFENAFKPSGEQLSEDEIGKKSEDMLVNLLKRPENKTLTTTVDIKLKKNEKSWTIEMDDSVQDAVLGGLVSAMKELAESFKME